MYVITVQSSTHEYIFDPIEYSPLPPPLPPPPQKKQKNNRLYFFDEFPIMRKKKFLIFHKFQIAEMAASTFLSCLISDYFYENHINNSTTTTTTIFTDSFYDNDLLFTNSSVFMVLASDSDCVKLKVMKEKKISFFFLD